MADYGPQHLPTPLLVDILSRLSSRADEILKLASVCKPFKEAALLLSSLHVIFRKGRGRGPPPGATALILRMPALRSLSIKCSVYPPFRILRALAGHCCLQLRILALELATWPLLTAGHLSAFSPLIKLQCLSFSFLALSQEILDAILKLCPALVSLDIEFRRGSLSCIHSPLLELLRLHQPGGKEDESPGSGRELYIAAPRLAELALENVAEGVLVATEPPAHDDGAAANRPLPLRVLHVATPHDLRQLSFTSSSGGAGAAAGTRLPALRKLDLEALSLPPGAVMALLESGVTSLEEVRLISRMCSNPHESVPLRLLLSGCHLASLTVNSSILRDIWQTGGSTRRLALSFRHLPSLEIEFDDFKSDLVAMLEAIVEQNHASLRQVEAAPACPFCQLMSQAL